MSYKKERNQKMKYQTNCYVPAEVGLDIIIDVESKEQRFEAFQKKLQEIFPGDVQDFSVEIAPGVSLYLIDPKVPLNKISYGDIISLQD